MLRAPDGGHGDDQQTDDQKSDDQSLVNQDDQKTDDQKTDDQQTDDKKADDQKSDDQKSDDQKVEPLTVESLAVPEGFELQEELSNKFLEILNGDMAPQDRANALLALHAETINAASEASSQAWDEMQTKWKDEAKADPDIGGTKLQPTISNVQKLVNEFGSDDLRKVFDLTGAGNNVHMIKFLNVIADKLTEGKFFTSGGAAHENSPTAAAERMYPTANKG